MISKYVDLRELANLIPITLLSIFHKIFLKLIYLHIASHLFQRQSSDLNGFRSGKRSEDALLCAEIAIEHHHNSIWNYGWWTLIRGKFLTLLIKNLCYVLYALEDFQNNISLWYLYNVEIHASLWIAILNFLYNDE